MIGFETVSLETLLVAGYAGFLALVAAGIGLFSRFTPYRSRYRNEDGLLYGRPRSAWPFNEIAQFQRGLSAALLVLAGFVLVIESFRHHSSSDLTILCAGLLAPVTVGRRILKKFHRRREITGT